MLLAAAQATVGLDSSISFPGACSSAQAPNLPSRGFIVVPVAELLAPAVTAGRRALCHPGRARKTWSLSLEPVAVASSPSPEVTLLSFLQGSPGPRGAEGPPGPPGASVVGPPVSARFQLLVWDATGSPQGPNLDGCPASQHMAGCSQGARLLPHGTTQVPCVTPGPLGTAASVCLFP